MKAFFPLQRIEDFQKSFNKVATDVGDFTECLAEEKSERGMDFEELYKSRSGTFMEMQNVIKLTVKNGKDKLCTIIRRHVIRLRLSRSANLRRRRSPP